MNEDLIDYKTITIYPIMAFTFYLFCKKYYKYMLYYNLFVLDTYYTYAEDYDSDYFDDSDDLKCSEYY